MFGQILDAAGAPAANVSVHAYLSDTTPLTGNSPLTGNAALIGNAGAALDQQPNRFIALSAIRLAAGIEERTDALGRFVLRPDRQGVFNLEAVQSDAVKAWKAKVPYSGIDADVGSLQLAPVGQIAGKVRGTDSTATELANVSVYVPGSSYLAITKADGSYSISSVPVGAFDLAAFHVDLGDAKLADTDSPNPIQVESGKTVAAPILTLKFSPPVISQMTRPGSLSTTDNAAPGQTIEIHGSYFGLSRGAKAQVEFTRAVPIVPERLSDSLMKVVVPPDAANGRVVVSISGRPSIPFPIRVLKRFDLTGSSLSLTRGATADLSTLVSAYDSDDIRIVETVVDGVLKASRPLIDWSSDSGRAAVQGSIVAAVSEGEVNLTARAGTLSPKSLVLKVIPPGVPTPPPGTPSPVPSPSATPVPALSPTPTVVPHDWDLVRDFSRVSNPNGSWSFGWKSDWSSAFNLFGISEQRQWGEFWLVTPGEPPEAWKVTSAPPCECGVVPGQVSLHPGPQSQPAVVRWTAPTTMRAHIVGRFGAGDIGAMTYRISHNGVVVYESLRSSGDGPFDISRDFTVGEILDFAVGDGYGDGNTPLTVLIEQATPTPGPTPIIPAMIGQLAPDDRGDPAVHHDYLVTKEGVTSTFVWVPVFTAYQVINPAAAGCASCAVGQWVKDQPTSGTRDADWAADTFGGFYAGKFEASRADAVPGNPATAVVATAGSSATLKVQARCVPWTDISWTSATQVASGFFPPFSHLMRDDEWTALAVWSMINGKTVFGNNAEGDPDASYLLPSDVDNPLITFMDDPSYGWGARGVDRALSGTGTASSWARGMNLTTHTGADNGVYDLNGNVTEWTMNVGAEATSGSFMIFDIEAGRADTGVRVDEGTIVSLATDPRLRRLGVPGQTIGQSSYALGHDHLWKRPEVRAVASRGGCWVNLADAGVWALGVNTSATYNGSPYYGFRPALVF